MCFVFIWEKAATCATYIINWLVFITEMKRVYFAVWTGSLNKAVCTSSVKGCLGSIPASRHRTYNRNHHLERVFPVRFGYTPLTTLIVKCVGKTMRKDLNSLGLLWAVTYSISAQVGSSAALPLCMCLISKSLYIASDGRVSVRVSIHPNLSLH